MKTSYSSSSRFKTSWLAILSTVLILSACGGGGGGGSGSNTALSLNSGNAESISNAVVMMLEDVQDSTDFLPVGVVVDGSPNDETSVQVRKIITEQIKKVLADGPSGFTGLATGVQVNIDKSAESCLYLDGSGNPVVSGSLVLTGNVGDVDVLDDSVTTANWTSGDTITMTFTDCAFIFENVTFNGSITIAVSANFDPNAIADPSQCTTTCNAAFDASFNNFGVTIADVNNAANNATITASGGFGVDWAITPTTWTETMTGSSYTMTINMGGVSAGSLSITNFSLIKAVDFVAETYTMSADARVSASTMNGYVDVSADYAGTVNITYDFGTGFIDEVEPNDPTSGTVTITGGNSSVTITATSGSASITVDSDGNGSDDGSPISTTWNQLEG